MQLAMPSGREVGLHEQQRHPCSHQCRMHMQFSGEWRMHAGFHSLDKREGVGDESGQCRGKKQRGHEHEYPAINERTESALSGRALRSSMQVGHGAYQVLAILR